MLIPWMSCPSRLVLGDYDKDQDYVEIMMLFWQFNMLYTCQNKALDR